MNTFRNYLRLLPPGVARRRISGAFLPRTVAQHYGWPLSKYNGAGTAIAIISLGGGVFPEDVAANFAANGLAETPNVTYHSVLGATNAPGDPADLENILDLSCSGCVAPAAALRFYSAPNSDAGFVAAIRQATADAADVISISWGQDEKAWDAAGMAAMNAAFSHAAAMKVAVCVAAGDNGSSDGASGLNVDYPASDPYVLGCGGTSLIVGANGALVETVWNSGLLGGATGGGFSGHFARPSYQNGVVTNAKRSVPDWAANADPNTGYLITYGGAGNQQVQQVGGTSCAAPLLAGLIALRCQALKARPGYLNPVIYALKGAGFRDIVAGNNGSYKAGKGFDECTGWGCPTGAFA